MNIYVIWYKDYLFCFYRLENSIEWNTPLCSNSLIQSTQVLEETLLQILYLLGFLLRLPIIYGKLSITTPLICLFFPKKSKSLMSKRHYRLSFICYMNVKSLTNQIWNSYKYIYTYNVYANFINNHFNIKYFSGQDISLKYQEWSIYRLEQNAN